MASIETILGKDKYIKADLQIKAKELGIKGISKMDCKTLIEVIINENNKETINKNKDNDNEIKLQKNNKKATNKMSVSKTLKNNVWDTYVGKEKVLVVVIVVKEKLILNILNVVILFQKHMVV